MFDYNHDIQDASQAIGLTAEEVSKCDKLLGEILVLTQGKPSRFVQTCESTVGITCPFLRNALLLLYANLMQGATKH